MDFIVSNIENKPIKVIFQDAYACPLNPDIKCSFSQIEYDKNNINIYCNQNCILKEELL